MVEWNRCICIRKVVYKFRMNKEIEIISNIIFEYKENFKDTDFKEMMDTLKRMNNILPNYSYNKSDELSLISYKIYKLENEVRILKELKEEILRERVILY